MATTTTTTGGFGAELRAWRTARRWSQLDLAGEATVSQRHVSFLETGRARPSREMVLHLADVMEVPLRARNVGLLAAGYAPAFPERALDEPEMEHLRTVLTQLLEAHDPFPAYVVDHTWTLVLSNRAAIELTARFVAADVVAALGANVLRLLLHPDGLRPAVVNWEEAARVTARRAAREGAERPGDEALTALIDEVGAYPGVDALAGDPPPSESSDLLVPLHLRDEGLDLRLFTTIATIGGPHDVTLEELRLETLLPADAETAEALRRLRTDPTPT